MATVRIGTSGWHYKHWVGPFYPERTPAKKFLSYYGTRFRAAEVNNTFYSLPSTETLAGWRDETPEGFVFACKASRYITHMKKLKAPEQSTARFFDTVAALGSRLGPVLFQLPPNWSPNAERLESFLDGLPGGHRYAFEFRDERWFDDDVLEALRRHHAACVAYDFAGETRRPEATADFDYVRLHGPSEAYQGRYDDKELDIWASWIGERLEAGHDVYCYFDNDEAGHAANDALRLGERLNA